MRGLFGIYFYGHELDQDGYRDVVDGELDTEHSPRLSELVMHCERAWFSDRAGFYPIESLASLGVTVIPLPDVESLLSGASHFRPCPIPIVESHLKVSRRDLGVERWESLSGDMAEQLWQVATFMLEDARRSRGNIKELTGWAEIYGDSPYNPGGFNTFWGILNGFISGVIEWGCVPLITEWCGNTQTRQLPHIQIYLSGGDCSREDGLDLRELRFIVSTAYNRAHQPDFEDETVFPILVFSELERRRVRIIEAVFDRAGEKLTVKVTPVYSFWERTEAPWEAFNSLVASSPQERRGCSC